MEQKDLFSNDSPLSDYNCIMILKTMAELTDWGKQETVPYRRQIILDYFNQLKVLMEAHAPTKFLTVKSEESE